MKLTCCLLAALPAALHAQGVPVSVPGFSFETPAISYADTNIDDWQDLPQPYWYDPTVYGPWATFMGEFANDVPGSSDYIYNMNGNQAAFIFGLPQCGIFQDYNSTDWTGNPPTHAFDSVFSPGMAYQLTVAVLGGAYSAYDPMEDGVTLDLILYYRDSGSNMVTVGDLTVTNTAEIFTNDNYFSDYTLTVPGVSSANLWAGQNIGIELLSTATFENEGGYWDVDNVRLTQFATPCFLNPKWSGNQFSATVLAVAGETLQILESDDLTQPAKNWNVIATYFNTSGIVAFTDVNPGDSQRFYMARERQHIEVDAKPSGP